MYNSSQIRRNNATGICYEVRSLKLDSVYTLYIANKKTAVRKWWIDKMLAYKQNDGTAELTILQGRLSLFIMVMAQLSHSLFGDIFQS